MPIHVMKYYIIGFLLIALGAFLGLCPELWINLVGCVCFIYGLYYILGSYNKDEPIKSKRWGWNLPYMILILHLSMCIKGLTKTSNNFPSCWGQQGSIISVLHIIVYAVKHFCVLCFHKYLFWLKDNSLYIRESLFLINI